MSDQPRPSVLLLEDDPEIARLETQSLERVGYSVSCAETAEIAFSKIRDGHIDVILLEDRLTTGTSGLQFLNQLRATGNDIPAILVTKARGEDLLLEALRAGVRDVVPKTEDFLDHLEPTLRRILDKVHSETSLRDAKRCKHAEFEENQRKDQFLSMLAHELRNPLAPISNAVQIMKVEGLRGPNSDWSIKVIDDQVKYITRMVDDLLEVSRITRGQVGLRKEILDLRTVIDVAVEAARPLMHNASHTLSVSVPESSILLDVDPARMSQVLRNLLSNAAKYTDDGGQISLSVVQSGHEVLITVSDNGVGMPPELVPNVFDMFTQADQSLSRSRGGLGIGLTLVRSLVEMHNGSVTAHSEGIGRGSDFEIKLPLVSADPLAVQTGDHSESIPEPISSG